MFQDFLGLANVLPRCNPLVPLLFLRPNRSSDFGEKEGHEQKLQDAARSDLQTFTEEKEAPLPCLLLVLMKTFSNRV